MLDKIKGLSTQVADKANGAVEGIASSVKGGVESLANTAGAVTGALNETAIRAATAQMCNILEIALAEIKDRPLSRQAATLTATVNIGITALELQVQVPSAQNGNDGNQQFDALPQRA